jgi:CheY-like chemotaxis protein
VKDPKAPANPLAERLRQIGVEVRPSEGARAALGWLSVSPIPFRTLGAAFTVSRARFYVMDRQRIKFSHPRLFFDLPAIDVTRCHDAGSVERALRRAWEHRLTTLREAEGWLDRLGADTSTSSHATRLGLHLTGASGPPAIVLSSTEILLPSSGPLADAVVARHGDRVHRPLPSLDLPSELELGLTEQMRRVAVQPRAMRSSRPLAHHDPPPDKAPEPSHRILILDDVSSDLASVRSSLNVRGFELAPFRDAARALDAFRDTSFDLVISGVRLARADGLEFAARVRALAGIERLPIVLLDEHENRANAKAAIVAGAAAYLSKPFEWDEAGELMLDLIKHPSQRRFTRYAARLPVRVVHGTGTTTERTESIARGGIALRTRRDPAIGTVERFRIRLPDPLQPVDAEGVVVTRITLPGQASLITGIRFLRFGEGSEPRWIRLVEALERRNARSDGRRDPTP